MEGGNPLPPLLRAAPDKSVRKQIALGGNFDAKILAGGADRPVTGSNQIAGAPSCAPHSPTETIAST